MFYGAIALKNAGLSDSDETFTKALNGLRSFQVNIDISKKHSDKCNVILDIPFADASIKNAAEKDDLSHALYQQCCISPVWDTAWAGVALLEAGVAADDARMMQTSRWLISKQITDVYGDWSIKNPGVMPGGWSFEFENKQYPDVDDSIEILTFLHQSALPFRELREPFKRGLDWILSMQCKNGGFAAFDKDNNLTLLNRIPFADHGACLDPPTADITGRMLEFLIRELDYNKSDVSLIRMADFILTEQSRDGSFWGRWGVNYVYGTWCALGGLCALGRSSDEGATLRMRRQ
jgi:squalene-hopene/tetraprenyl-beta-curcumene cyclase